MDYRLGARNGVALIREARALRVQVPFILLTGDASPEVDLEGMEAGAADYLQKSALTATALDRSVRYAMQQRKLEVQRIALAVEQAARERPSGPTRGRTSSSPCSDTSSATRWRR